MFRQREFHLLLRKQIQYFLFLLIAHLQIVLGLAVFKESSAYIKLVQGAFQIALFAVDHPQIESCSSYTVPILHFSQLFQLHPFQVGSDRIRRNAICPSPVSYIR